jgi:DNA polymerase III delta' subunit
MSIFQIVKGQEQASELLGRSMMKDRLAHAYLFAGPMGVGKLTAALELAAVWMCSVSDSGYCGTCNDCKRVFRFQHPDVRLTIPQLEKTEPEDIASLFKARADDGISPLQIPGNSRIKIAQIREMRRRLSRKSFENKGHIEIIVDSDRMGVEAANALLKTLEEPPDDTVIILISSAWSALLPTIRSRAHLIRFRRLSENLIVDILMDRKGMNRETAAETAVASDGRPGVALNREGKTISLTANYDPLKILGQIVDKTMASPVISIAVEVSQKLGKEGALEFTIEMQSILLDLRRRSMEMKPLTHTDKYFSGVDMNDDEAERLLPVFQTAETRLRGNGIPRIVLAAAFLGAWKILKQRERTRYLEQ